MKDTEATKGDDWRVLTAIRPPVFSTDGFKLFERDHWRTVEAIRSGIHTVETATWESNSWNLRSFFRLDDERQCFAEAQFEWTNFLEPQITRGLVHFLDTAPTPLRKARCVAFARAVSACCKPGHRRIFQPEPAHVRVVAEEVRIDILLEFADEHGRYGTAVEAKFNHRLTEGQLESAVEYAEQRGWDLDRSCFLVVSPHIDRLDCEILDKNGSWSSVTWWSLLRHIEREISIEADCPEFRRFRSTIWSQSYA